MIEIFNSADFPLKNWDVPIHLQVVQMGDDAVLFPLPVSAGGGGEELVLPSDQEVAGGRIATPVVASSAGGVLALWWWLTES